MALVATCCFQFITLEDPDDVQTGPKRQRTKEKTPSRSRTQSSSVLGHIGGHQKGSNALNINGQLY